MIPAGAIGIGAGAFSTEVEKALEGHSVFTTIESIPERNENVSYAASVAVLVRETTIEGPNRNFFGGVLWFNDQYLVESQDTTSEPGDPVTRYPCHGAVVAVPAGAPDPRLYTAADYTDANYVETYHITDPNDHIWNVDKWLINGGFVWTVAIGGEANEFRSNELDDGVSKCPLLTYTDGAAPGGCLHIVVPETDYGEEDERCMATGGGGSNIGPVSKPPGYYKSPGNNTYNYPCGGGGRPACPLLKYNAVLYFELNDLTIANASKNHTEGSTDWRNDVSGCQTGTDPNYAADQWPCPADNDAREGNSHPFNPFIGYPLGKGAGKNNHGGSADCTGDAIGDQECHATRDIDIYYAMAPVPNNRNTTLYDGVGYLAPFHCHGNYACDGSYPPYNDL